MALYHIANGPMPTTAAQAPVTTGTAIKTLLQIKPFKEVKIVEWGISFDGIAANLPIRCELLETGTINATVTASVDNDISKYDDADGVAASVAGLTLATSGTGYTGSAEGSITAVKMFEVLFLSPMGSIIKQFPLGREPRVKAGQIARIRVTAAAAVNAYCYMVLDI